MKINDEADKNKKLHSRNVFLEKEVAKAKRHSPHKDGSKPKRTKDDPN